MCIAYDHMHLYALNHSLTQQVPFLEQVQRGPNKELHELPSVSELFVPGVITDLAGFHRPRDYQGRILDIHEPTEFHSPRNESRAGRLLGVT